MREQGFSVRRQQTNVRPHKGCRGLVVLEDVLAEIVRDGRSEGDGNERADGRIEERPRWLVHLDGRVLLGRREARLRSDLCMTRW